MAASFCPRVSQHLSLGNAKVAMQSIRAALLIDLIKLLQQFTRRDDDKIGGSVFTKPPGTKTQNCAEDFSIRCRVGVHHPLAGNSLWNTSSFMCVVR